MGIVYKKVRVNLYVWCLVIHLVSIVYSSIVNYIFEEKKKLKAQLGRYIKDA